MENTDAGVDTLQSVVESSTPLSELTLAPSRSTLSLASSSSSNNKSSPLHRKSSTTCRLPTMSATEQIARQTRKSSVLDQKNALLVLAIPDYDDYKQLQPYSCRSLSNKEKFVGGRDFITRHNPQDTNDFKKQFSRDVGNLNRHRSILAPPVSKTMNSNAVEAIVSPVMVRKSSKAAASMMFSMASSSSLRSASNQSLPDWSSTSFLETNAIWQRMEANGGEVYWILTQYGVEQLIGPEYKITTRKAVLPPPSCDVTTSMRLPGAPSPTRATSPARPFTSSSTASSPPFSHDGLVRNESTAKGLRVDLLDAKQLACLSRLALYHQPPPWSPSKAQTARHVTSDASSLPALDGRCQSSQSSSRPIPTLVESASASMVHWTSPYEAVVRHDPTVEAKPTTAEHAMELSPPQIRLYHLKLGQVYMFPLRVRNVGIKQTRFRVKSMTLTSGSMTAAIAEIYYDKRMARLAAGLATVVTLTVSFQRPGTIRGNVTIEIDGMRDCLVPMEGSVH